MDKFKIYSSKYPKINDNVVVIFTKREESHFEGILVEYDTPVIMSYNNATKKKKINVWNKIVPFNKPMLARVEDIDQVSIAYNKKYKEDEDELEFYNQNKFLISSIKKICILNNIDFNNFWVDVIFEIDKKRLEYNEENEDEELFKFFNNNLNLYEEIIKNKYENHESIIKSTHDILITKKINKITSHIGIISTDSIIQTQSMLKKIIEENNEWEYKIKLDTVPNYIIESFSNNSSIENHEHIISNIEKLSKEYKLFTKVKYVGKI